jgi:hypothetical protein
MFASQIQKSMSGISPEHDLGAGTALRLSYNGSPAEISDDSNADQFAPVLSATRRQPASPLSSHGAGRIETNGGRSNYNGLTAAVTKRFSHGLQFQGSYAFVRNLTNAQGYNPTSFASEGVASTDLRQPDLDYGNVAFPAASFPRHSCISFPSGNRIAALARCRGWQRGGVSCFSPAHS